MSSPSILVMIPYPVSVGFAIGRLVEIFCEAGLRWTESVDSVHFSFSRLDLSATPHLPQGFANLVEFDYRGGAPRPAGEVVSYVRRHSINTLLALDLPVQSPYLRDLRDAGVETVVSYWGAPMSSMSSPIRLLAKRIEVSLLRPHRPDRFVFESEAMRAFAVRGRGLPESRTCVIPTGTDPSKFQPVVTDRHLAYERLGIPRDRKIVVFMGHLHRRKGVHVLLRAAEHWVSRLHRTDIHCLFLGDRPGEAETFRDEFDKASPYVTFGGYRADVPEVLAGCTIGCVPSTGWDSFPMSSLEMQACGLPVIASDLQGVPETISNGMTGIVVPAGDAAALARAVTNLSDDPDLRRTMSQAARDRILAGYTREHQIRSLVALLRDCAA